MNNTLEATRKMVRRYWTEDGLPDLCLGLGLVVYGLLSWWAVVQSARWVVYLQSLFLPVWIGFASLALRWLKERVTYPRTGFVAYADPPQRRTARRIMVVLAIGAMLALILLVSALSKAHPGARGAFAWLLPLLFFLGLGTVAWHQSSLRYAIYALVALLSGLGAAVRLGGLSGIGHRAVDWGVPLFLILGAVMLAGGAWQLLRYLHRHPEAREAA